MKTDIDKAQVQETEWDVESLKLVVSSDIEVVEKVLLFCCLICFDILLSSKQECV